MKEQLSEENVRALVSYRLSRAKETLAEIPNLKDMGYLNPSLTFNYPFFLLFLILYCTHMLYCYHYIFTVQ